MPGSHVLDVDREGPDGSPFGQVRAWGARGFEGILRGLRDPTSPLVLSQFISAGTAFLINIIASRALAPSGRGELALLLQIAYLSSLVMMFGTDRSLLAVYPGAAVRDVTRAIVRLLLWPTVIGLACAVLLAVLPLSQLGSWQLRLSAAAVFTVVNAFVRAVRSVAIATGRSGSYLRAVIIDSALLLLFFSVLGALGNSSSGTWVLFYAIAGTVPNAYYLLSWARSTVAGTAVPGQPPAGRSPEQDRRRQQPRREGIQLFPAAVATSGMLRLDRLLLPAMASTTALGVYAGIGTMTEVLAWPLFALADARLGQWRQAHDDGTFRIAPVLLTTLGYSVLAGAFFVVVIRELAVPLLGEAYVAENAIVLPLVLAAMIYGMSQILVAMLTARRRNAMASIAETVGFVVSVAAYLVMIPRSGALGAAYASLIGYGASFAVAAAVLAFAPQRRSGRLETEEVGVP